MIRKSLTALFLILALVWATTVPAQQRTPAVTTETTTDDILYAQYEAQFEAEFTAYAATHTEAEVQAYFQQRINQMTSEALTFDGTTTQGAAIALDGSAELMPGDIFIYPGLWDYDDGSSDARLRFCLDTRNEECRNNYNAELAQSANYVRCHSSRLHWLDCRHWFYLMHGRSSGGPCARDCRRKAALQRMPGSGEV